MMSAARRWLGRVPATDPFQRRTAITVQTFCLGLSALLIVSEVLAWSRGLGVANSATRFGSLANALTVVTSLAAIGLIRKGKPETGYAFMLGGYVVILSLSLGVRGLAYHQIFLPRVFAVLLVLPALLLGRRALWTALGVLLLAMFAGQLRDRGLLGGHGPLEPLVPALGIWSQIIIVMILLCVVLDRFGAALTEAYATALERRREAERVSQELRLAKESLEAEMERRRVAESMLFESQKLEAVGRLSGGVAHDFNNLLTAILGFAHLGQQALPADEPRRRFLEGIVQASQRGAALTHQLLAFARRQIVEPRAMRIEDGVRALEPMLHRLIGENVRIDLALDADPRAVLIDPVQLEQVLVNLSVNARDAMPHGGTLRIETGRREVRPGNEAAAMGLEPGDHVRLLVADTGVGMDATTVASAFEPFFTTKEVGRGTGLGLATCYGIVRQAGGSITVTSAPGRGTAFEILLPITHEIPKPAPVVTSHAATGGAETILVVEDDQQVLDVVARVLRGQGYSVVTASSPEAAEELVRRHSGALDLLLTDVVMPGKDGRRLAEALVQMRPTLMTLFMSGYSDEIIARHGALEPGLALLMKPFAPEALVEKVREVLDARGPSRRA